MLTFPSCFSLFYHHQKSFYHKKAYRHRFAFVLFLSNLNWHCYMMSLISVCLYLCFFGLVSLAPLGKLKPVLHKCFSWKIFYKYSQIRPAVIYIISIEPSFLFEILWNHIQRHIKHWNWRQITNLSVLFQHVHAARWISLLTMPRFLSCCSLFCFFFLSMVRTSILFMICTFQFDSLTFRWWIVRFLIRFFLWQSLHHNWAGKLYTAQLQISPDNTSFSTLVSAIFFGFIIFWVWLFVNLSFLISLWTEITTDYPKRVNEFLFCIPVDSNIWKNEGNRYMSESCPVKTIKLKFEPSLVLCVHMSK